MMLKMTPNSYHHPDLQPDPFSSLVTEIGDVDQKSSLGFMELLGFQDYNYSSNNYPSSVFDNTTTYQHQHQHQHQHQLPPPVEMEVPATSANHLNEGGNGVIDRNDQEEEITITITTGDEESSVVLNGQPSSPNCSSICTSTADQRLHNPVEQCIKEKKAMGGDEAKPKKKKKEKAPRFAFMTRTEIDHLDDGYRWRKYGQKAVKNSRFPRSYYRCTSATCNVKKRVERCMSDPSYVITTYEGQHNHPVSTNSAPLIPSFNHLITSAAFATTTSPPAVLKLDQGGLLQDMLHCHH